MVPVHYSNLPWFRQDVMALVLHYAGSFLGSSFASVGGNGQMGENNLTSLCSANEVK